MWKDLVKAFMLLGIGFTAGKVPDMYAIGLILVGLFVSAVMAYRESNAELAKKNEPKIVPFDSEKHP